MWTALLLALQTTTLPNGLEVSILADPAMPVVATQVWYHVGAANEDKGSRGLAHLFEHLMFGGTAAYAKGDYSKFVTHAGGDENAFTTEDETVYVSAVPPDAFPGILRREGDRMRNLVVDDGGLENEKKIVLEELRLRTENDPMTRLLVEAQHALLAGHPYSFDPSGSKEDVAHATVPACRAFYDAHYRPNRAHLVVVGNVSPDETLAQVQEAFGGIEPGGVTPPEIPALLDWTYPDRLDLREDIPPVEIALTGMPLPPADAPDAAAVEVLRELLTGGTLDPFREIVVRDRKKALEAGIEWLGLKRGGGIVFYAASLPYRRRATAFRSIDASLAELDRLAWLTDETLEAAKRRLRRDDLGARYYAERMANEIGEARWHRGDAAGALTWSDRLDAVTRDEVAAAWKRYVSSGRRIRVYVKPERVPATIRMFGWLYPLFS
jgi:zinc protease